MPGKLNHPLRLHARRMDGWETVVATDGATYFIQDQKANYSNFSWEGRPVINTDQTKMPLYWTPRQGHQQHLAFSGVDYDLWASQFLFFTPDKPMPTRPPRAVIVRLDAGDPNSNFIGRTALVEIQDELKPVGVSAWYSFGFYTGYGNGFGVIGLTLPPTELTEVTNAVDWPFPGAGQSFSRTFSTQQRGGEILYVCFGGSGGGSASGNYWFNAQAVGDPVGVTRTLVYDKVKADDAAAVTANAALHDRVKWLVMCQGDPSVVAANVGNAYDFTKTQINSTLGSLSEVEIFYNAGPWNTTDPTPAKDKIKQVARAFFNL